MKNLNKSKNKLLSLGLTGALAFSLSLVDMANVYAEDVAGSAPALHEAPKNGANPDLAVNPEPADDLGAGDNTPIDPEALKEWMTASNKRVERLEKLAEEVLAEAKSSSGTDGGEGKTEVKEDPEAEDKTSQDYWAKVIEAQQKACTKYKGEAAVRCVERYLDRGLWDDMISRLQEIARSKSDIDEQLKFEEMVVDLEQAIKSNIQTALSHFEDEFDSIADSSDPKDADRVGDAAKAFRKNFKSHLKNFGVDRDLRDLISKIDDEEKLDKRVRSFKRKPVYAQEMDIRSLQDRGDEDSELYARLCEVADDVCANVNSRNSATNVNSIAGINSTLDSRFNQQGGAFPQYQQSPGYQPSYSQGRYQPSVGAGRYTPSFGGAQSGRYIPSHLGGGSNFGRYGYNNTFGRQGFGNSFGSPFGNFGTSRLGLTNGFGGGQFGYPSYGSQYGGYGFNSGFGGSLGFQAGVGFGAGTGFGAPSIYNRPGAVFGTPYGTRAGQFQIRNF